MSTFHSRCGKKSGYVRWKESGHRDVRFCDDSNRRGGRVNQGRSSYNYSSQAYHMGQNESAFKDYLHDGNKCAIRCA